MQFPLPHFLRTRARQRATYNLLYLDYAAATPVLPAVAKRMHEVQLGVFGNPGAIHAAGVAAKQVVDEARLIIARTIGVRTDEVIFTASGTEANNLAIIGTVMHNVASGKPLARQRVITTKLEHPSVLVVLKELANKGLQVDYVPVDSAGAIDRNALQELLTPETSLITFAYANSEIGTVQDVKRISRLIRQYNTVNSTEIKTLVDAAQAPLWLPCQLHTLGVDMLTLDAGKCNGPKGIGFLIKRADVSLTPIQFGGGQEHGLRPGTENVPAIAGAAKALQLAQEGRVERSAAVYETTKALVAAISETVPEAVFNGPAFADTVEGVERLPNNVHISLPGLDTEYAVVYLDSNGIAASTRSACSSVGGGVSNVVLATTNDTALAIATIRFSIDPAISPAEIPRVASTLRAFIDLMQSVV